MDVLHQVECIRLPKSLQNCEAAIEADWAGHATTPVGKLVRSRPRLTCSIVAPHDFSCRFKNTITSLLLGNHTPLLAYASLFVCSAKINIAYEDALNRPGRTYVT